MRGGAKVGLHWSVCETVYSCNIISLLIIVLLTVIINLLLPAPVHCQCKALEKQAVIFI